MFRLAAVTAAVVLGGAVALADDKDKGGKPVKLSPDLAEILKLVNKERAKEKLPELTLDPKLCKAAQQYAEVMAKNDKLAARLDGKKASDRVEAAGYDWKTIGENLGIATGKKEAPAPNAAALLKHWMETPETRKAILNGKHLHTGLGMARGKGGDYYYSQVFASPRK
jgi:uncharacterized protein YkwD